MVLKYSVFYIFDFIYCNTRISNHRECAFACVCVHGPVCLSLTQRMCNVHVCCVHVCCVCVVYMSERICAAAAAAVVALPAPRRFLK